MKAKIIINEQHKLLEGQKNVIKQSNFDDVEFIKIPASGMTLKEQKNLAKDLTKESCNIIFVSPVPALMTLIARELIDIAYLDGESDTKGIASGCPNIKMSVFHNDRRKKKELPNGKIISTVAKKGWQLV